MFLKSPHKTTRNYGALLKSVGTEIFGRDHRLEPYYVAAYAHYRLDYLFRNQTIAAELKPARYHMLMAYGTLAHNEPMPKMNSHEMERYCKALMTSLWDDDRSRVLFEKAADGVRKIAAGNLHRDNIRTEPFTNSLLTLLASKT